MEQNKSTAVMQRRHEPDDTLNDFPTPQWATRALCEWLYQNGFDLSNQRCLEPAANRGYMVRPLREYFQNVVASDVHDYGVGFQVSDFFKRLPGKTDWIITNPPFAMAEKFIKHAMLSTPSTGVAVLVRIAFLESIGRYNNLFYINPPTYILQFSERVVIHKSKVTKSGSTATAYCWLVWDIQNDSERTAFHWIPPWRKALEKEGDYEIYGTE